MDKFLGFCFLLTLIIFGIYLFFLSKQKNTAIPWDFGIVILGIFLKDSTITLSNFFSIKVVWPFLLLFFWHNKQYLNQYILSAKKIFNHILLGSIYGTLIFIVFYLLHEKKMPIFIGISTSTSLLSLVNIFLISGIEELLFRCILLTVIITTGIQYRKAILLQGILFSFSHFPRYFSSHQWLILIFVTIIGLVAGKITYKQKSLIGSIFLHGLFNIYSVIFFPS